MDCLSLQILFGVATIILTLYYHFTSTFDFWKVRNVPGPKPIPLFGNIKDVMLRKVAMCHFLNDLRKQYKDAPMVGIFTRRTPILVLHDPKLIKHVLIRDFSNFANRGIPICEKAEPLSPNLFNLEVDRWRPLRSRLSPVFRSGKMKEIFPLILECSDHLQQYLDNVLKQGDCVEVRELMAKYNTDVIGSCAFGIEAKALADTDSEFRRVGRTVFKATFNNIIRFRLRNSVPWLYELLSGVIPQEEISTFFTNLMSETLAYRDKNNIVRPDFVDVLLQLRKQPDELQSIKLTDAFLAAQAFVFFIAGFESPASMMSNTLYELALNPDIQDKVRKEIREFDEKNKGEIKYEQLKEMRYFDMVVRETLRKYPSGPYSVRQSTTDYTFEGTKVTIPKGVEVWIPLFSIHRNPKVYPNPDAFIPERFTEEAVQARNPMDYIPFGDGPRICIGIKFSDCQTKVGLIKILRNYRVDVCEKTMIPYVYDPASILAAPKGGIHLKITKLEGR